MVLSKNNEECCGCTACKCICPSSAITMVADEEGFLYPCIDLKRCVDCGLCKDVCAFQNGYHTPNNYEVPHFYAVRHKKMIELLTSRSGAMFAAITDYILSQNGVVYGAGYGEHFHVIHERATTKIKCNEFKGSKYVQSDLNETFIKIKNDLANQLTVLFSGTPCQTAALYSYLSNGNVDITNLYVCDIVCHGTPSPLVFSDYIKYLENKYKDTMTTFNFRDKESGWKEHVESFNFNKTNKKITAKTFSILFFLHVMLRPSCHVCKYTNFRRPSDITLGDYWGWERLSSTFNSDDKGVSLVIVNTQKGMHLFESVAKEIDYLKSTEMQCTQPNLLKPSSKSNLREIFWSDYQKKGFYYIGKKYGDLGIRKRMNKYLRILLQIIKRKIK